MRGDDFGVSAGARAQAGQDFFFGLDVDGGQCIVQNQDRGFNRKSARDAESLTLPAG